ncbi:MAG TPA: RAxF-45 family protein [Bacillus sp. (in: firmicutes)]|nr:RAxF-45 family protein [Bacillus litorisediminis]HWO74526.1 RAxF-45 family protein [Bacillus sp. (in: firmicutes)]
MNRFVVGRSQILSFLSICCAILHAAAANGIRMPIFSNCITTKQ